jgi:peptide/nickel transport system ATP-binding protein
MGAIPMVGHDVERLTQIEGSMPRLTDIPEGCSFNPRCTRVIKRCFTDRPDLMHAGKTDAACWHYTKEKTGSKEKASA